MRNKRRRPLVSNLRTWSCLKASLHRHPQNVNRFPPNAKHASVATVKQMSVSRTENFVFRNEGTSFGAAPGLRSGLPDGR